MFKNPTSKVLLCLLLAGLPFSLVIANPFQFVWKLNLYSNQPWGNILLLIFVFGGYFGFFFLAFKQFIKSDWRNWLTLLMFLIITLVLCFYLMGVFPIVVITMYVISSRMIEFKDPESPNEFLNGLCVLSIAIFLTGQLGVNIIGKGPYATIDFVIKCGNGNEYLKKGGGGNYTADIFSYRDSNFKELSYEEQREIVKSYTDFRCPAN